MSLEKKYGLVMCRETHSNAKYLCGRVAVGDWKTKCRLLAAICGALRDLYHVHNLTNVKNTHGGVLILVKLHTVK